MSQAAPPLHISLSGIARLAKVQRPVVSMWRTRAVASGTPFPAPVAEDRGSEVFDAWQIAEWLVATGRGNNPDVLADAAAHATHAATGRSDETAFHALTALVALRAAVDQPLGVLDRDSLLDLADGCDPDDACILTEIEGLGRSGTQGRTEGTGIAGTGIANTGDELMAMARFVDVLVDGAFGAPAAFESILGERFRDGRRTLTRTALEPQATALVSELAVALANGNPAADSLQPVFVDPTGASGDLLMAVLKSLDESVDATAMVANTNTAGVRLLRRRLMAHHLHHISLARSGSGEFTARGAPVLVAQFPNAEAPTMTAMEVLSEVDNVVVQMDDAQRAVVLAPASVLVEGRLTAEADAIRSQFLRSGALRAVVRLPRGLLTSSPRQSMALWVFGPAHETVARADRWTMVADLGDVPLVSAARGDLVSDLVAAMGDGAGIRAHSFRFARPVPTSVLLARSGSLVAGSKPVATVPRSAGAGAGLGGSAPRRTRSGADFAARLDATIATLGEGAPASARRVSPSSSALTLPDESLGALAASRHVRVISGARLRADDLDAEIGYSVIGVDELMGTRAVGSRTLDHLVQAATYPAARLTEPGDVVFWAGATASAERRVLVDTGGFSVVAYPARILRINRSDPAGLVSHLLASDIARQSSGEWKRWVVRRVAPAERAGLAEALNDVAAGRAALAERLRTLDALEEALVGGIVAGTLTTNGTVPTNGAVQTNDTVTPDSTATAAIIAPPEGTTP